MKINEQIEIRGNKVKRVKLYYQLNKDRYFGTINQVVEFIAREELYPTDWGLEKDINKRLKIKDKIEEILNELNVHYYKNFKYYSYNYAPNNS